MFHVVNVVRQATLGLVLAVVMVFPGDRVPEYPHEPPIQCSFRIMYDASADGQPVRRVLFDSGLVFTVPGLMWAYLPLSMPVDTYYYATDAHLIAECTVFQLPPNAWCQCGIAPEHESPMFVQFNDLGYPQTVEYYGSTDQILAAYFAFKVLESVK